LLFSAAAAAALQDLDKPVITHLDLNLLLQDLVAAGHWKGEPLQRLPRAWDHRRTTEMIGRLAGRGILAVDPDFDRGVWRVESVGRPAEAAEVACVVDPFCYVSDDSAMFRHGLIETDPPVLQISTLAGSLWRARRQDQLSRFTQAQLGARPFHARVDLSDRIRKQPVRVHEARQPAQTVVLDRARVATLGEIFAQSLTEPARYGGMPAVLRFWDEHAPKHLEEIVPAVDRSELKIVKVRAGHILTERLGAEPPGVWAWLAFAQRGGSRKLDPERPYAPVFSERWMLSLNV
jgi:hypothetical protein